MPAVIALRNLEEPGDPPIGDIYFLVKEQDFPVEALESIKFRIKECIKCEKGYDREDIIAIAELTIEEYHGTLIPFILYNVLY